MLSTALLCGKNSSAQWLKPELHSVEYFTVVDSDTLNGWYTDLNIKNGKFKQLVESTFRIEGKGIATSEEPVSPKFDKKTFILIEGEFNSGHRSGNWFFGASNFKHWSTCYGSLNWKRVDYSQPDSIKITDFRWRYTMTPDSSYIRGHIGYGSSMIFFECVDGICSTRTDQEQTREAISFDKLEMIKFSDPWILLEKPRGRE